MKDQQRTEEEPREMTIAEYRRWQRAGKREAAKQPPPTREEIARGRRLLDEGYHG